MALAEITPAKNDLELSWLVTVEKRGKPGAWTDP